MSLSGKADGAEPQHGQFHTTHWSVVLAAGEADSSECTEALEKLCRTYWYPLYAYVRRRGYGIADAQDLTQTFFAHLLSRNVFARVAPTGGKFRSFLLTALKNFLIHDWEKAKALKRGGNQVKYSLDQHATESRYALELTDSLSPDLLFERRWAETLLDLSLEELRREYATAGKQPLFDALVGTLTGTDETAPYVQLADQLAMTEAAVKMAAVRLRKRYRELLRQRVAETVSSLDEIDEELRALLGALGPR